MEERARSRAAIATAIAIHWVAYGALELVPSRARRRLPSWSAPAVAVEVDPISTAREPLEPMRATIEPLAPRASKTVGSARGADTKRASPTPGVETDATRGEEGSTSEREDDWSDATPGAPFHLPVGLPWSERLSLEHAPAPTAPPVTPRVRPDAANLSLMTAMRAQDAELGLGNSEEAIVATAVQDAGRAAAVPRDTRFRVEVELGRRGQLLGVRVTSASAGTDEIWRGVADTVRSSLGETVQIGPAARVAGVTVVVDAEVKHLFVAGADEHVVVGPCPTTIHTSGMWPADPFHWVGGEPYGDYATGSCALSDTTNGQPKQIRVRTKVSVGLPGAPPPPASSFPKHRERRRLPSLQELILLAIPRR